VKVNRNVSPVFNVGDLNAPPGAVTVCGSWSWLVQVTVVPTGTVKVAGEKAKSRMSTALVAAGAPGCWPAGPDPLMPGMADPGMSDAVVPGGVAALPVPPHDASRVSNTNATAGSASLEYLMNLPIVRPDPRGAAPRRWIAGPVTAVV